MTIWCRRVTFRSGRGGRQYLGRLQGILESRTHHEQDSERMSEQQTTSLGTRHSRSAFYTGLPGAFFKYYNSSFIPRSVDHRKWSSGNSGVSLWITDP